ncbi:DUF2793 domain-containing protein [Bradyrhizobium sp.]|uniref:DUF2793 domain-containing protein n=1 Tax=Bradyrhizobium sp. TaxID=376 RepID=UPI0025B85141|nr:DUF2793 domain-containing protein [Bradyrhizobium sp.]
MRYLHRLFAVASAAFFIVSPALAQNPGTVTANAFAIGRGPGTTGYASLLCTSAQLAVGQSAAAPICRTLTGDVTLSAAGVTAIGATKVTSAMLNADVFSTAHSWAGQQTFVAPALGTPASGVATNLTGTASGLTAGNVTTNANLTGDVTSVGNATTLTNAPVIAKVLTGFASSTGTVTATDSILTAVQKLYGNDALKAPIASPTFTGVPAAPTAAPSNNSTQIATTAYVDAQVAGGVAGVASLNGKTGAVVSYFPPQGRLTLATSVPVMTTTQSAKTTIYYTPYVGNMVPLYDGTNMVPTAVAEISVATTDTVKNPAAIGASKVNDWFVWNDAGTVRLSHGPDWTSDTARSAGTALVMVNGIYLNNAAITNGPAASRGTYVGTTRSNGSSQLDFIFGATAAGGTAGFLGVWNAYNRVNVSTEVRDSTASWTYSSGTPRQANNSAGNRVTIVVGLSEDSIIVTTKSNIRIANTNAYGVIGIGEDSATAVSSTLSNVLANGVTTAAGIPVTSYSKIPAIGVHYYQALEFADGINNATFFGADYQMISLSGKI